MRRCLFLKPIRGAGGDLPDVMDHTDRADEVAQYDLDGVRLADYAALMLPAHLDQRWFGTQTARVTAFLDGGGTLVFNGHVAWPMLPEFRPFVPLASRRLDDLRVNRLAAHPVFDGVAEEELTFRRGVAGFYGRGHNPPPDGAVALHGLGPGGAPVDWVWERPRGGRILMHAGNDLWMYAGAADTTGRIVPQLIAWACGAPGEATP